VKSFNFYEDRQYAEAYSRLEFPGTYYLAFRDLPQIFEKHINGVRALDFGCGAGRSARFLKQLGFQITGVDISAEMLQQAKEKDPEGDYRLMTSADFSGLPSFDLILSAFPFDNIPGIEQKIKILKGLRYLLNPAGRIVNLVSAPEVYVHEWECFSTKDFSENRTAKTGDEVRVINRAIPDARPVVDIFMTDEAYRDVYSQSDLEIVETQKPLARADEPFEWVNETSISPWVIYVLRKV
jgi:trans-aconitate methyltransferase